MHKVFVYGSLLTGYSNNSLLREQKFVSDGVTEDDFSMVTFGGFPGVMPPNDNTELNAPIKGELWEVDDVAFGRLDMLESNGYFYEREVVTVHGSDEEHEAWMYVLVPGRDVGAPNINRVDNSLSWDAYCDGKVGHVWT